MNVAPGAGDQVPQGTSPSGLKGTPSRPDPPAWSFPARASALAGDGDAASRLRNDGSAAGGMMSDTRVSDGASSCFRTSTKVA